MNNLKAATMAYFAKNSLFVPDATDGSIKFDQRLITAGEMERPFSAKLGDAWACNAVAASAAGVGANNRFSKLDGSTALAAPHGRAVRADQRAHCRCVRTDKRIDGVDMSAAGNTADTFTTNDTPLDVADDEGRVTYATPDADKKTNVYIYIAHK